MGAVEGDTALISLVSNAGHSVETVDLNEAKVYTLSTKAKVKAVRLAQRRLFALTGESALSVDNALMRVVSALLVHCWLIVSALLIHC